MVLLASFALGLASALFPPVNIEAYLVGLAALHDGPLLWLAVLLVTAGHMVGKLAFYALGRGWLIRRLPRWMSRKHALDDHLVAPQDEPVPTPTATTGVVAVSVPVAAGAAPTSTTPVEPPTLRSRVRSWSGLHRVEAVAGRPWATATLCFVSASVGLPPFAVVAVLLGRFRMPVVSFLVVGGLGRLVRFAAVAGLSGSLLG